MSFDRKKLLENLSGKFYATAIGSLPHKSTREACDKVLKLFIDIPFWPQLARRTFLENMYVQFSEGLPGAIIDVESRGIMVDTSGDISGQIEKVYEKFLADDVDSFSISRDYAGGFYELVSLLKGRSKGGGIKFLKGQVTGPVSLGLTVTDQKKRAILYNTELKEALLKILVMKARWQIRKLKELSERVMIFVDEPYLVSIGSSYVSLDKNEASSDLGEIIDAIHQEGALCGIHCCGNTDWGFVLNTDIDILSFDAYEFFESLTLYPEGLKDFLKRGGFLAWGIIPSSQLALKLDASSLVEKLNNSAALLEQKGFNNDEIMNNMLITPSCGCGALDKSVAEAVLLRTVEVSARLKSG